MKTLLLCLSLVFMTACEADNKTIVLEMVDDEWAGMQHNRPLASKSQVISYKQCKTNQPSAYIEGMKEEAKEANTEIRKVTIVEKCPDDAVAVCEAEKSSEYYYTDVKRILDSAKTMCDYMKGKWSLTATSKN